jgi:hypothetical protein
MFPSLLETCRRAASAGVIAVVTSSVLFQSLAQVNAYPMNSVADFDTLEAAVFDPASKSLTIIGRRSRTDRVIRIPYVDHLSAALDTQSPTFSLTWEPESKEILRQVLADKDAFFSITTAGRLNDLGVWLFAQGGAKVMPGADMVDVAEQVSQAGGLRQMFQSKAPLHLPAALAQVAFHGVPLVRPEIRGMESQSSLAHVALDADLIAKSVVEMPDLKRSIPGYIPFSEFEHLHGDINDDHHVWLYPDKFVLHESADGLSVRFAASPMRFGMRKMIGGKSVPDPELSAYADLLSGHFEDLERQFPALHELRECEKILALTAWLRRHAYKPRLPDEIGFDRPIPQEIRGVVHVTVIPRAVSDTKLRLGVIMWPSGGIDLRVEDNMTIVRTSISSWLTPAINDERTLEHLTLRATSPTENGLVFENTENLTRLEERAYRDLDWLRWHGFTIVGAALAASSEALPDSSAGWNTAGIAGRMGGGHIAREFPEDSDGLWREALEHLRDYEETLDKVEAITHTRQQAEGRFQERVNQFRLGRGGAFDVQESQGTEKTDTYFGPNEFFWTNDEVLRLGGSCVYDGVRLICQTPIHFR